MDAIDRAPMVEPLDERVDHVRGEAGAPSSSSTATTNARTRARRSGRSSASSEELSGGVRFAFRHFPLTQIHPHALAASAAAEAAALQGRFWEMHELLFHRQKALEDDDLRTLRRGARARPHPLRARSRPATTSRPHRSRRRERRVASGEVRGTPTLFIDGVLHRGGYDTATLLEA